MFLELNNEIVWSTFSVNQRDYYGGQLGFWHTTPFGTHSNAHPQTCWLIHPLNFADILLGGGWFKDACIMDRRVFFEEDGSLNYGWMCVSRFQPFDFVLFIVLGTLVSLLWSDLHSLFISWDQKDIDVVLYFPQLLITSNVMRRIAEFAIFDLLNSDCTCSSKISFVCLLKCVSNRFDLQSVWDDDTNLSVECTIILFGF
jgi:hypothetical protein